jgi:glutamate transport system permease protein
MAASVLFDSPGPKARMRHLILSAVGVVVILGFLWVAYGKMRDAMQLEGYMWEPFITDPSVWKDYLLIGLTNTLKAAVLSVIAAGIFGILFGLGRLSEMRWVRWFCGAVVEFFRAVPVLMMMIFLFFGYFAKSTWMPSEYGPLAAVVIALMLYNGSVIAELIRSGVYSLPKGQGEAGVVRLTRTDVADDQLRGAHGHAAGAHRQFVVVLKDTALGLASPAVAHWGKTLGSAYGSTTGYLVWADVILSTTP